MQLDDEICYCFHVSKRKILNFMRLSKPHRASQLSECGGAGTGCGWCVAYLKRHFKEFQAGNAEDDVDSSEYSAGRQQHLAERKQKPPTT